MNRIRTSILYRLRLRRSRKLFFIIAILSRMGLSPLGTAIITGLLYQPPDRWGCSGATGGIKISRGNRCTRRKPDPASLCLPKIPNDKTCPRTWAAEVRSRRLTAWAMAWSHSGNCVLRHRSTCVEWIRCTQMKTWSKWFNKVRAHVY
jgi:hypothetical protein